MTEILTTFLETILGGTGLGRHALVFLLSMVPAISGPVIAIPIGAALGLPAFSNALASAAGNIFPVVFVVIFTRKIFAWIRTKSPRLEKFVEKYEAKAESRKRSFRYGAFLGLMIFVAIPLPIPGMGAWTGSMIAAILDVRLKTAFPAIALGVIVACIIVTLATYGFITLFVV